MSKVAIVYWSGTGNTEQMAESVANGARNAGADVTTFTAVEFDADKMDEFDAIAKARDDQHELGELKRVVNSLLQNMDTLQVEGINWHLKMTLIIHYLLLLKILMKKQKTLKKLLVFRQINL